MDNRVILAGSLREPPQTRVTPAGIPMTRFTLEHCSSQSEAGQVREVRVRIRVVASGEDLQRPLTGLQPGMALRVIGFITAAGYRQSGPGIVLHATAIEPLV